MSFATRLPQLTSSESRWVDSTYGFKLTPVSWTAVTLWMDETEQEVPYYEDSASRGWLWSSICSFCNIPARQQWVYNESARALLRTTKRKWRLW